jgi:hypothetical protein
VKFLSILLITLMVLSAFFVLTAPLRVWAMIRDVAITNVAPSTSWTYQGSPVNISITAKNLGNSVDETFDVKAYYDSNLIGVSHVTNLPKNTETTVTITWNTSGVPAGSYTIKGEATVVPYEFNTTNNVYVDGIVTVAPQLLASIYPMSASILVGQSVTFTSTVSGGYAPYTYQWYLNGVLVSGAISNVWTLTPSTSGNCYIHLKVTDSHGSATQSETAQITVASFPVGGYSVLMEAHASAKPLTPYLTLIAVIAIGFIVIRRKTTRDAK